MGFITRCAMVVPVVLIAAGPATKPAPATTQPHGPTITVRKVDEATVTGVLAGLEGGAIVVAHAGSTERVPLADVVDLTLGGGSGSASGGKGHQLTGRIIGTPATAARHGKGNAFDGNVETFYESAKPNFSDAWLGLDLAAPKRITLIRFCPRPDRTDRMIGGRFEASNSADFSGERVQLAALTETPPAGKFTERTVTDARGWRYVRYVGPPNSGSTVNEIEFWGEDEPGAPAAAAATTAPYQKPTLPPKAGRLAGTVIGTEGSWQNEGRTRDNVFDGDLTTFFDAPAEHSNDAWVGLDLGTPKSITRIQYAPRSGYDLFATRTVGGKFQGSSTPDFSNDVTDLAEIKEKPTGGKLTGVAVDVGNKRFRYVRYLSPVSGQGNIAEVEFWGGDAPGPATVAGTAPASQPGGVGVVRVALGEADELTGQVVAWSENSLRLKTRFGDAAEIDLPTAVLREVWRGTADQVKQAKALPLDPGPEDAAFVVKADGVVSVRGVVLGVEGESLRFKFGEDVRKINVGKLVGVILGGQDAKRDRSFKQTVLLNTGDTISGRWNGYDPATATLRVVTPWGSDVRVPHAAVAKIRSANGRLVYVSDLKPAAVEQTPYFDRMLGYRIDKSLTGGPLKLIDGDVTRGIAVHARTVLTYDVGGGYETFKAKVGFQQPEGKLGQAIVRITGDGKVLYEDLDARGDAAKPAEVSVSVAGVRQLSLEVDFGKNQDTGDRVVWAHARLLKAVQK